MRLIVNNKVLDIKEGTKLSFQKVNPLFAFDDLKCERSQSFDIPSTPRNDSVFGIVNPAWNGIAMRRRFDAQLQNGIVVKNGYLYVDSYSDYMYKAIFVTGELLGLQRLNNAGKLSDVASDMLCRIGGDKVWANVPNLGDLMFDNILYRQARESAEHDIAPSVSVSALVRNISSNIGARVSVPSEVERWRIVPPYAHGMDGEQVVIDNVQVYPEYAPTAGADPMAWVNNIAVNNALIEGAIIRVINYEEISLLSGDWRRTTDWHYKIGVMHNLQGITFKFPENFPEDVFLIRIINDDMTSDNAVEFLGGYSFRKASAVSNDSYDRNTGICHGTNNGVSYDGEPLTGKSVDVPLNSFFVFVTPEDYVYSQFRDGTNIVRRRGWCWSMKSYRYEIEADGTNDVAGAGEFVRMHDNLPDMKFVELLKTIASVSGKVLNYTDEDGVTFDELHFSTWVRKVLDASLVKVSEQRKVFGDYARRNVITYTRDENTMKESDVLSASYIIDNDNLEETDTLAEIKFANAGEVVSDSVASAYIDNAYEDAEQYFLLRGGTEEGRQHRQLKRLPITLNAGLASLCGRATSIKAVFRMSLYEFESIKQKTIIVLRGVEYVWTKADWSNQQAQFELSAIG